MPVGSSYSTVKRAIVDKLSARPGLSDVAVSPQPPTNPEDVNGVDGSRKAIWIADAEGEYANVVLGAPSLWIEETYDLTLVAQALPVDGADTQIVTDQRVDEMLYEILMQTATDTAWGITSTSFVYLEITRGTFRRLGGPYTSAVLFPSRCELDLSVQCRIQFDPS